jgi:hypothetical protein
MGCEEFIDAFRNLWLWWKKGGWRESLLRGRDVVVLFPDRTK